MNHHRLEPGQWLQVAATLAIAFLLVHGSARAEEETLAATTACATSIAACGCTITKAGTYTVTSDLSSSQALTAAGDCIAIKASNVILNLHDFAVQGPGSGTSTGAGIDVLKSSSGAFIEGGNSQPSGWKYGLEVQGNGLPPDARQIISRVGRGFGPLGAVAVALF